LEPCEEELRGDYSLLISALTVGGALEILAAADLREQISHRAPHDGGGEFIRDGEGDTGIAEDRSKIDVEGGEHPGLGGGGRNLELERRDFRIVILQGPGPLLELPGREELIGVPGVGARHTS
jgi:hypothetical protein